MINQMKTALILFLALALLMGCSQAEPPATPTLLPATPTLLPATPTLLPATPTLLPGTSIRSTDEMLMIEVQGGILPGGTGSLDSFWFDQMQVTFAQYLNCVEAGACELSVLCSFREVDEEKPGTADQPVLCARWSDAKAYCEWSGGRLPTEIEWNYAAQVLDEELPPWGNTNFGFRCLVPTFWPAETWPTQGWITSTPAEQGMDPELIAAGIEQLKLTFPKPHSLLIVRHGFLVVEEYYHGYRPDMNQDVASVNKSFLSALIGIAINQGAIPSIDTPMMDYFPEYATQDLDPLAYDVTIEHLLTMTSGFYWPEHELGHRPSLDEAFSSGAPQELLFASPIIHTPGSTFNYCTACTHTLSMIIQKATGMPTQDIAQEFLMAPLGIPPSDWSWNHNSDGYNTGGWGFYLTPRDMAKIGYIYLNNGLWDGEQIIPEEWARTSHRRLVDLGQHEGYGYLWWTGRIGSHPAYYAAGHGGQYIYILPTLDLIVVVTQETSLKHGGSPTELIRDYFAIAVLDP